MSTVLIIYIIVNGFISLISIIGNIIIAHISKYRDLALEHKYNRYLPMMAVQRKDPTWILETVEKYPYSINSYCKKTRRYIIARYKQLLKQAKNDS